MLHIKYFIYIPLQSISFSQYPREARRLAEKLASADPVQIQRGRCSAAETKKRRVRKLEAMAYL